MKRIFAGMAAALLAAVLFFPCKVSAISAKSAVLLDAQSGRILYERCKNDRSLIASTTKIMTALIVCEQCNVLDRMVIPKEAVGVEGSSMYLREGEVLTVQELLYGMMLCSGNDAATALAIYCGGTVEGFAELMNDKARKLGMVDTHFVNPHGLDSVDHYSTAYDLAVLASYAMENPIFQKTVSAKSLKVGERYLSNHNKLLWRLEGVDGVKTGFTKAAGRILVSSATRDDRRLIAVTINAPDDWNDHITMLESGFRDFRLKTIVDQGETLNSLGVISGAFETVDLVAADGFSYPLRDNEEITVRLPVKEFVYAPISEGNFAGYAYMCLEDEVVGKIPLVYSISVDEKKFSKKSLWQQLFGDS